MRSAPCAKRLQRTQTVWRQVTLLIVFNLFLGCQRSPDTTRIAQPSAQAYAHYLRGMLWARRGVPLKAFEAYQKALASDRRSAGLRVKLAEVLMDLGRVDEALEHARRAQALRPELAAAHLIWGLAALEKRKFKAAEKAFARAGRDRPGWKSVYWARARLYTLMGKEKKRGRTYRDLLKLDPDNPVALMALGRWARLNGYVKQATAALRRCLQAVPWYGDAHVELAYLALAANKYDQADNHLEKALKINDDEQRIALLLWRLRLIQGRRRAAWRMLDDLGVHGSAAYRVFAARRFLELGRLEKATAAARQATRMKKEFPAALVVLAEVALRKGDAARAVALARRAVRVADKDNHSAAEALAGMFLRAQRCNPGISVLKALGARKKGSIALLAAQAVLEAHCGNGKRALARLEAKKRMLGLNAQYIFKLAVAQEAAGRWRAAVQNIQRLLLRDPEEVQALNFVGFTWAEHGVSLAKAQTYLARAAALSPLDPYVMDSLAVALIQKKQWKKAVALLKRARRILPLEPEIMFHLGFVREQQARRARALKLYRKALHNKPLPKVKRRIERRLSGLLHDAAR